MSWYARQRSNHSNHVLELFIAAFLTLALLSCVVQSFEISCERQQHFAEFTSDLHNSLNGVSLKFNILQKKLNVKVKPVLTSTVALHPMKIEYQFHNLFKMYPKLSFNKK